MTNADEKNRVALVSVLAALFLTVTKVLVGLATGSLGVLSEAAHSSLDLVAAVVTAIAVRISGKPADQIHQFGHGKVESFSALIETFLLLATSSWVIYEGVKRIVTNDFGVDANIWSFGVMVLSVIVGINRAALLSKAAKKFRSQALEADALHFASDVYSSIVVLVGLGLVKLGLPIGDPIAALGVAVLVVVATFRLGRETINVLLDTAPAGMTSEVEAAVTAIAGIRSCPQLRIRQAGTHSFVDARVELFHDLHMEEVEALISRVEVAIIEILPDADVTVRPISVEHPEELEAIVHARHRVTPGNTDETPPSPAGV